MIPPPTKYNMLINRRIITRFITTSITSPKLFDELTNDEVNDIIKETDIFFMRKVSNKCILPSYFDNII